MRKKESKSKNVVDWAIETYYTDKDMVNLLAISPDPVDKALGTFIKTCAGVIDMETTTDNSLSTTPSSTVGTSIKIGAGVRYVELMADNSLKITPSSTGPARSEKAECTTSTERMSKEGIDSLENSSDPSDDGFGTFIEMCAGVSYMELMDDNSLKITPSSTGPARSERAERTTPTEKRDVA